MEAAGSTARPFVAACDDVIVLECSYEYAFIQNIQIQVLLNILINIGGNGGGKHLPWVVCQPRRGKGAFLFVLVSK